MADSISRRNRPITACGSFLVAVIPNSHYGPLQLLDQTDRSIHDNLGKESRALHQHPRVCPRQSNVYLTTQQKHAACYLSKRKERYNRCRNSKWPSNQRWASRRHGFALACSNTRIKLLVLHILVAYSFTVFVATSEVGTDHSLSTADDSNEIVLVSSNNSHANSVKTTISRPRKLANEDESSEGELVKHVLETTSVADNASFGNMFDIQVRNVLSPGTSKKKSKGSSSYDLILHGITGIRVSKFSTTEHIEIYTKPGSHVGYEFNRTAWTLVLNTTLHRDPAIENGQWMPVPEFKNPIGIPAGEKRAFFVILTQETLLYTSADPLLHPSGTRIKTVSSKDGQVEEPLNVFVGIGINHYPPFQAPATSDISDVYPATTENRIFSGQITYSVGEFSKPQEIDTSMNGGNQNFGVLFDITAGEEPEGVADWPMILKVSSFDFLTNVLNANITARVLIKNELGSYLSETVDDSSTKKKTLSISDGWSAVCSAVVEGRGPDEFTPIPPESCDDVFIPRGETQAFLLILDKKELLYSNYEGTEKEDGESNEEDRRVFSTNDDLTLWVGHGAEPILGDVNKKSSLILYPNRSFNGAVHYSVEVDPSATDAPTSAPTWAPIEEEVVIDEATAVPLRTQQIISLELVTKKELRRWRRLGEELAKQALLGGERQNRYLLDPYDNNLDPYANREENFLKGDVDNRDQASKRDQFFDPYVLLYVENTVHNFLEPYMVRNDPPIDLSKVRIHEGVPLDAHAFQRKQRHRRRQTSQIIGNSQDISHIRSLENETDSIEEENVAETNAEMELDEAKEENIEEGSNVQEEDEKESYQKSEEHNTLQKTDDEETSQPQNGLPNDKGISIDFYTTIDGEYNPPPSIDFDGLVESLFDNAGDRFVRDLKTSDEEKGKLFEEVADDVQLQRVTFSVPDELLNKNPPTRYSKGIVSLILTLSCLGACTISTIVLSISHKKREKVRQILKEERAKKMEMQRRERASAYGQGTVAGSVFGSGSTATGVQYHNANDSVIGGGSVVTRGDGSAVGGPGSVAPSMARSAPSTTRSILTLSRLTSQRSFFSHHAPPQHSVRSSMNPQQMHDHSVLTAPPNFPPDGPGQGPPMNPMSMPHDDVQMVGHGQENGYLGNNNNYEEGENSYDPRINERYMHVDEMNDERIPLDRDHEDEGENPYDPRINGRYTHMDEMNDERIPLDRNHGSDTYDQG